MWIERNKDGKLILFSDKTERNQCCENVESEDSVSSQMILSDELAEKYSLNDITFEDGPVEVSLNRCVDYTEEVGIYANCADLGMCAESYPVKRPDNFYLNKLTYNDNYFKVIKRCVYDNYVIINFEYAKDSGDINIFQAYIDSVATLEHIWNNDLKKIYSDEPQNDETESIDDEISEDFDDCCPMEDETEETNLDKQESENSGLQPQPLESSDSDVVTTVDRAIEIEALKAKFCGFILEGETPGETDFNIFSYAYKKGIEHSKNYPEAN